MNRNDVSYLTEMLSLDLTDEEAKVCFILFISNKLFLNLINKKNNSLIPLLSLLI
jgi:hypothetical protein